MTIPAIPPVGAPASLDQLWGANPAGVTSPALAVSSSPSGAISPVSVGSFERLLVDGVDSVNSKLINADKMVQQFAIDDSIPVHQVTYALAQARLSLELALQIRSHLVEGYQQLMNMQL